MSAFKGVSRKTAKRATVLRKRGAKESKIPATCAKKEKDGAKKNKEGLSEGKRDDGAKKKETQKKRECEH